MPRGDPMALSLDFAFEGFRIIRQKPKLMFFWGGAAIVMYLAFLLVFGLAFGSQMVGLFGRAAAAGHNAQPSPAEIEQLVKQMMPLQFIMIIPGIVISAIFYCAVFRASFQYPDERFGYLRCGRDELRQAGVLVLYYIASFVIAYLFTLATGLTSGGGALASYGFAAKAGIFIVLLCAVIWLSVRMSLLGPLALERRKLDIVAAFRLSQGHFWSLLIGYLIMAVMTIVVFALAFIILLVVGGIMGAAIAAIFATSHAGVAGGVIVVVLVILLFAAFYGILISLLLAQFFGPPAAAYKALSGYRTGIDQVF